MNFLEKLSNRVPTLSFELFPPKKPDGWATLYATLSEISKLRPDLVSVTYGAGGSTREKTIDIVTRLKDELQIDAMAHLTCVSHTKDEIDVILNRLRDYKIQYILALRGDPHGTYELGKSEGSFKYASELIRYISFRYKFIIGCATYPEKHLESNSIEEDIKYLKLKQDTGARFAITQLFFINENFYRFRELALKEGVNIPIIAGIMPIIDLSQIERFRSLCGCIIPDDLLKRLNKYPDRVIEIGIEYSLNQCLDLLKNGVSGIHFFTLNRSYSVVKIVEEIKKATIFGVD
ncbi:MAG: methylenetetrahydrofolate reductase [NAD(P)H] [Deltaproteobacteria bacterium]|nr:methylenetetrahydrofolate reductase [NAD(P)H] [Deltaproteobacteria bacterium]